MTATIMVIDDALDQMQLLSLLLEKIDPSIKLVQAQTGPSALKQLRENLSSLPQVILLDLKLYGQNGLEILQELKKDERLQHIPVCLFSNAKLEQEVLKAYQLGAAFYFQKPIGLGNLKAFLESFIQLWFRFAALPE